MQQVRQLPMRLAVPRRSLHVRLQRGAATAAASPPPRLQPRLSMPLGGIVTPQTSTPSQSSSTVSTSLPRRGRSDVYTLARAVQRLGAALGASTPASPEVLASADALAALATSMLAARLVPSSDAAAGMDTSASALQRLCDAAVAAAEAWGAAVARLTSADGDGGSSGSSSSDDLLPLLACCASAFEPLAAYIAWYPHTGGSGGGHTWAGARLDAQLVALRTSAALSRRVLGTLKHAFLCSIASTSGRGGGGKKDGSAWVAYYAATRGGGTPTEAAVGAGSSSQLARWNVWRSSLLTALAGPGYPWTSPAPSSSPSSSSPLPAATVPFVACSEVAAALHGLSAVAALAGTDASMYELLLTLRDSATPLGRAWLTKHVDDTAAACAAGAGQADALAAAATVRAVDDLAAVWGGLIFRQRQLLLLEPATDAFLAGNEALWALAGAAERLGRRALGGGSSSGEGSGSAPVLPPGALASLYQRASLLVALVHPVKGSGEEGAAVREAHPFAPLAVLPSPTSATPTVTESAGAPQSPTSLWTPLFGISPRFPFVVRPLDALLHPALAAKMRLPRQDAQVAARFFTHRDARQARELPDTPPGVVVVPPSMRGEALAAGRRFFTIGRSGGRSGGAEGSDTQSSLSVSACPPPAAWHRFIGAAEECLVRLVTALRASETAVAAGGSGTRHALAPVPRPLLLWMFQVYRYAAEGLWVHKCLATGARSSSEVEGAVSAAAASGRLPVASAAATPAARVAALTEALRRQRFSSAASPSFETGISSGVLDPDLELGLGLGLGHMPPPAPPSPPAEAAHSAPSSPSRNEEPLLRFAFGLPSSAPLLSAPAFLAPSHVARPGDAEPLRFAALLLIRMDRFRIGRDLRMVMETLAPLVGPVTAPGAGEGGAWTRRDGSAGLSTALRDASNNWHAAAGSGAATLGRLAASLNLGSVTGSTSSGSGRHQERLRRLLWSVAATEAGVPGDLLAVQVLLALRDASSNSSRGNSSKAGGSSSKKKGGASQALPRDADGAWASAVTAALEGAAPLPVPAAGAAGSPHVVAHVIDTREDEDGTPASVATTPLPGGNHTPWEAEAAASLLASVLPPGTAAALPRPPLVATAALLFFNARAADTLWATAALAAAWRAAATPPPSRKQRQQQQQVPLDADSSAPVTAASLRAALRSTLAALPPRPGSAGSGGGLEAVEAHAAAAGPTASALPDGFGELAIPASGAPSAVGEPLSALDAVLTGGAGEATNASSSPASSPASSAAAPSEDLEALVSSTSATRINQVVELLGLYRSSRLLPEPLVAALKARFLEAAAAAAGSAAAAASVPSPSGRSQR